MTLLAAIAAPGEYTAVLGRWLRMIEGELRPQVVRRRRRRSLHVAIGLAIPLQLAATAAIATRCAPPARIERETVRETSTIVVPAAAPSPVVATVAPPPRVAVAARPACPPPRTDAPRMVPPALPEEISRVRPSPSNAGWIAAWNDSHVYVSRDAGASFVRVLDGVGPVRDVGFDCFGRVIVVRASGVGIREDAHETWRELRALQLEDWQYPQSDGTTYAAPPDVAILGGGPDVVIAGSHPDVEERATRVAISGDIGGSWRYHDLPRGEAGHQGRQHANGTIDVTSVIPDCMSEDLEWSRIAGGHVESVLGPLYGIDHAIYGKDVVINGRNWRRRADTDLVPIAGLTDDVIGDDGVSSIPGPFPLIHSGARAFRVRNGRAHRLPWVIEGESMVADPAGRIWGVVCGQPSIAGKSPSPRTC